jgi:hypothetical protein
LLRLTTLLALASCGAACSNNAQVVVVVIAPDGGDPFLGVDAATQARITLENTARTSTTVPVMANGSFQLDVRPASNTEISRLRIEALRDDQVIATGVTTPVAWSAEGNQVIRVLMQFADSVTAVPFGLPDGRSDCQLLELGGAGEFIGCFTLPTAQGQAVEPAVYDVLHHGLASGFAQQIPGEFTGDATVVIAGNRLYLVQGDHAVQYVGDPSMDNPALDVSDWLPHDGAGRSTRAGLVRSSAYHSDEGGWLLGGNIARVPVYQVDHFTSATPDGGVAYLAFDNSAARLAVPRSAPQVVELTHENLNPKILVAGGNTADTAFLEIYRPMGDGHVLDLGVDDTNRTHAAIACIHVDENAHCDRVIILGGRNGDAAGDDLIVDVATDTLANGHEPVIRQRGRWLSHRRDDAHVALAEGGRLLVAGGDDASGAPVRALEVLDVHDPDTTAPTSLDLHVDSCEHAMVHSLTNGSVIIMGGTLDGTPCTDIAFYRH